MTHYLSRLQLSRRPSARALEGLLMPKGKGAQMDAHHRLLWSLFADDPDRRRDFLWRAQGEGAFLILSKRPPASSALFARIDTKPFTPDLARGDRLHFMLRANATRSKRGVGRVDVVMDALFRIPRPERKSKRMAVAQSEGERWLERQGTRQGFALDACKVTDYAVRALPDETRKNRKGQPQFGILDLQGTLAVTDPDAFLPALTNGLGRAKAFGCGLMLVRRAS